MDKSIGAGLGISGFGLALLVSILGWQNVDMPQTVVVVLYLLAAFMFVGGVGLILGGTIVALFRRAGKKAQSKDMATLGLSRTVVGDGTGPSGDKSALAGDVRIITMPGIEGLTPSVRFTTEGKRGQSFNLRGRPTALRFVTLGGRIVREGDLPVEIPCGNGKLVIKRFTDSGFLWDEEGTIGDRVQVEFYPLATSTP